MANCYKLPKGWLDKAPISSGVIDSTFIAFKTPLDYGYRSKVRGLAFEVNSVFEYTRTHHLRLGLWIDLTCTNRYYDKKEVIRKNCTYLKFSCTGGGSIPPTRIINRFIKECSAYKLKFPNGIIAVHCTHGHNRTGFFIISYLVRCRKWPVEAAIHEFAKVRPPGIYRERYLSELCSRFGPIPRSLSSNHEEIRFQRRKFKNYHQ